MKDHKLEKGIKEFIRLIEQDMNQDPATAGDETTTSDVSPQAAVNTTPSQAAAVYEPGEIQHAQTNIKFLSTLTMFTSVNPPDSDVWSRENNPQYIPLKDGRILKTISKLFPEFKIRGAGAARYADNQFRIVLRGLLRAPTKIIIKSTNIEKREEEPEKFVPLRQEQRNRYSRNILNEQRRGPIKGTVEAYLGDIKINNRGTLPIQGEEGLLKSFEDDKEKIITLKGVDLSTLMSWTGITPPEEEIEIPKEKEMEPEAKEKPKEKEEKKQKGFGAKRTEEQEIDNPHFDDIIKGAMNAFGFKKDQAIAAAKKAMEGEKVKTDADIARIITKIGKGTKAYAKQPKEAKREDKDIYFRNYFRMLLEAQKSEDLEGGGGGEILNNINDNLYKNWFESKNGIAAPTNKRIFIGNLYQWFAAESAIFKAEKRIVDRVRKNRSITITLEGQLLMEVEIWVDARLTGGGIKDQWKFYMLSGNTGKEVATADYKTPGSILSGKPRIGAPSLQQQAAINPQRVGK